MLYLQWQLSLITFITAPIIVLIVRYFSKRLRLMSHRLQDSMGNVTHVLEESIDGHKVVRNPSRSGHTWGTRRTADHTSDPLHTRVGRNSQSPEVPHSRRGLADQLSRLLVAA